MELPGGWVLQQSRKTGAAYYWQAATNRSLWKDDTLPAGWGWEAAGLSAPRVYVHLATLEQRAERPSGAESWVATAPPRSSAPATGVLGLVTDVDGSADAASAAPIALGLDAVLLPPGVPQPSASNVAFDVYLPSYRARDAWLVRQLGGDAAAELAWWRAAAAAVAAASGGAAPALPPEPAYHADGSAAAPGAAASAAAAPLAPQLVATAIAALGAVAFAGKWDSRRKKFVVRHEDLLPGGGGGAGDSSRKRLRRDDGGSSSASGPSGDGVGLPTAAAAAAAAAAVAAAVVVRGRASYPAVSGAQLYTHPAFHSNAVIADIYTEGKVRGQPVCP